MLELDVYALAVDEASLTPTEREQIAGWFDAARRRKPCTRASSSASRAERANSLPDVAGSCSPTAAPEPGRSRCRGRLLDLEEADRLAPADDPRRWCSSRSPSRSKPATIRRRSRWSTGPEKPGAGASTSGGTGSPTASSSAVTHDRLAPNQPGPLLHGGAVADADGAAVLVLGASGAGKSTLIAHLASAGLRPAQRRTGQRASRGGAGRRVHPPHRHQARRHRAPPRRRGAASRPDRGRARSWPHGSSGPAIASPPPRRSSCCRCATTRRPTSSSARCTRPRPSRCCAPTTSTSPATGGPRSAAFAWLAATVPTCTSHYRDAASAAAGASSPVCEPDTSTQPVSWEVIPHEPWRTRPRGARRRLAGRARRS